MKEEVAASVVDDDAFKMFNATLSLIVQEFETSKGIWAGMPDQARDQLQKHLKICGKYFEIGAHAQFFVANHKEYSGLVKSDTWRTRTGWTRNNQRSDWNAM